VNLDAVEGCYSVNPGDGTWNDQSDPIVISDLIDENYADDIKSYRLYDIRVRVNDAYPNGPVSGNVSYAFDGFSFQQILTFSGQSSQFKGTGVSLLNPGGLIIYNSAALNAFVSALNNPAGRPGTIVLRSAGGGPSPVPSGVQVCVDVYVQADAEVN
jgi:hypothetical protein